MEKMSSMNLKMVLPVFVFVTIAANCQAQDNLVPAKYKSIAEASGDLDKDGIDEKVVIYDMDLDTAQFDGVDREVVIFKNIRNNWAIWQRSVQAVGNSKSGGMNSDPFWEMQIKNGILIISQAGGSSWKWHRIDKYRFQNNAFELIGCVSGYGRICDYWEEFDYNLSTGKINVTKEYETCEKGEQVTSKRENESFVHRLKNKITLQNRAPEDAVEIISPKYKHQLYL
jgi:hypothetical protein